MRTQLFTAAVGSWRSNELVTLPHLRRLRLHDGNFLINLTAPILEHLFSYGSSYAMLSDFIQRSSCPLTSLVLDRLIEPGSLVAFLQSVPDLRSLVVLQSSPQVTLFCDALRVSGTSADVCPNLTFLGYGTYLFLSTSELVIVAAMARTRLQLTSPSSRRLASFRIFCPSDQVLEHTGLEVLLNEGLDVAIVFGPEWDGLTRIDIS
jgi:hypothetical protein